MRSKWPKKGREGLGVDPDVLRTPEDREHVAQRTAEHDTMRRTAYQNMSIVSTLIAGASIALVVNLTASTDPEPITDVLYIT